MRVRELIEELLTMDPDLQVVTTNLNIDDQPRVIHSAWQGEARGPKGFVRVAFLNPPVHIEIDPEWTEDLNRQRALAVEFAARAIDSMRGR